MKTEVMSISEFMNRTKQPIIKQQIDKKIIYKVTGLTVVILLGAVDLAFASTGIDASATKIYYKLVNVGKWVIIIKGGMDTIGNVGKGDFDGAKKSFLSYILIYLLLLALPWGMNEVDKAFKDISS